MKRLLIVLALALATVNTAFAGWVGPIRVARGVPIFLYGHGGVMYYQIDHSLSGNLPGGDAVNQVFPVYDQSVMVKGPAAVGPVDLYVNIPSDDNNATRHVLASPGGGDVVVIGCADSPDGVVVGISNRAIPAIPSANCN